MSNPFDQFDVATASPSAPAPAAALAQTAPAANPFDQFDAQATAPAATPSQPQGEYGFAPAPPEQQTAPAPAAAPPAQSTPAPAPSDPTAATPALGAPANIQDWMTAHGVGVTPGQASGLRAGLDRSLQDVVSTPARWLAEGADALGLTHGAGDRVAAQNAADRQAYDAGPGQQPEAQTGRAAGQMLLTLPIGGAIGRVAGAAGDAIASGAGQISSTLGSAANRLSSFLQGTAGGSGALGTVAQGASKVAQAALQGGTAGVLTSGQSDQPVADQALRGAIIGGVAAPAVNALAGVVGGAGSGSGMNPEVQKLAQLARDKYGINLTADMISPNRFTQTLGSQLSQVPLSGMGAAKAALQSQFTKAVGNTIGEDVDQITPGVMENAAQRIGGVMDNVAAQTPAIPTANMQQGLNQVQQDASFLTPDQQGVIGKQLDNVRSAIDPNGNITGDQYQSLTKFNSPLGKALRSSDSDVRNAAIDIRGHLDDALQDSLPPGSDLMQKLQGARMQYKNLKTIEPLVVKGEPGEISPTALQGVVNRSFKGRGMRANQPDLGELADIGRQFNLGPDSGTAGRMFANATMGGAGGAVLSAAGGNLLPAAGIAAGLGVGRLASMYMRSPTVINKLLQSGANPAYAGSGVLNSLAPYAAPAAAVIGGPR